MKRMLLVLLLTIVPGVIASAQPSVWLVGGGAGVEDAQGQIERNVAWLERRLLERGLKVRTYFGLGPGPGKDSVYLDSGKMHEPVPMAHVARIFGERMDAGLVFARHDLEAVRGSTLKAELVPALIDDFAAHDPDEPVLFVYNGHGGLRADDTRRNYLRLWGGGRLDVAELDRIFDALPSETPVRFVMTQCYSGAFHSLVYSDPGASTGIDGKRCGFMSESAYEQAEGCSIEVDEQRYRDYSTFFFAALSGSTRRSESIDPRSVDRDGDGTTSFREAHMYTLAAAHSSDLPRSTSEAYLMQWTPWYLVGDSSADAGGSIYWTIAEEVAERYGWRTVPTELEARRGELLDVEARRDDRRRDVERRIADLRDALRGDWLARWPELSRPYSTAYHELLETNGRAIVARAAEDSRYRELVSLQDELATLRREGIDVRRYLTQIEKIYHLRKLARLETGLERFGSTRAKREYASLVGCERGGLD